MFKQPHIIARHARVNLGRASRNTKGAYGVGLEITGKDFTAGLSDD